MKFFKDFFIGIQAYWEAVQLIINKNLWLYFLFPTILSLIIFYGKETLLDQVMEFNPDSIVKENGERDHNAILFTGIFSLAYYIAAELSNYVVLIVLVPLLSFLSLRTEKILTGNRYKFSLKQLQNDITRAMNIAFRNMFRQILLIALWLVLALIIEPLSTFTPVVIFCIGFYYYGFSLLDYTQERRRLNMKESIVFIKKNAGMAIAIGAIFSIIFKLPTEYGQVAGAILAPILGIIAGTIAMHKKVDLSKNKFAIKDGD